MLSILHAMHRAGNLCLPVCVCVCASMCEMCLSVYTYVTCVYVFTGRRCARTRHHQQHSYCCPSCSSCLTSRSQSSWAVPL